MEGSPGAKSRLLEQRASELLQRADPAATAEIDDLLTECAGEALRVRAAWFRAESELHDVLAAEEDAAREAEPTARAISSRGRRLASEWQRLRELIDALRVERDRISGAHLPSTE